MAAFIRHIKEKIFKDLGIKIKTSLIHYYDSIGLISSSRELHRGQPSRAMTEKEYARLQQAIMMKRIGLSINQVESILFEKNNSPYLDELRRNVVVTEKCVKILKKIYDVC